MNLIVSFLPDCPASATTAIENIYIFYFLPSDTRDNNVVKVRAESHSVINYSALKREGRCIFKCCDAAAES